MANNSDDLLKDNILIKYECKTCDKIVLLVNKKGEQLINLKHYACRPKGFSYDVDPEVNISKGINHWEYQCVECNMVEQYELGTYLGLDEEGPFNERWLRQINSQKGVK